MVHEGQWQLLFGLAVCFVSAAVYARCAPYRERIDSILQAVCQLVVFAALLVKLVLDGNQHDEVTPTQALDTQWLLVVAFLFPFFLSFTMTYELHLVLLAKLARRGAWIMARLGIEPDHIPRWDWWQRVVRIGRVQPAELTETGRVEL